MLLYRPGAEQMSASWRKAATVHGVGNGAMTEVEVAEIYERAE